MQFRPLALTFALLVSAQCVHAADMGTTGLIDNPSARVRSDGEFAAVISKQATVDIYSLTYQATPWLETTFRYSVFEDGLYDRSYEAKLRLWREGTYLPQVSVGIRDLIGTGVWGSEYLVASKQIGPFDITLGAGWGRLADRQTLNNPLADVADRFATRDFDVGRGGTVRGDSFFSGPDMGLFGGVRYQVPNQNIQLVAEYSSDLYIRETLRGSLEPIEPWNFGIEWTPTPGIVLGVSHQLGQEWGMSVESKLDSIALPPRREPAFYISALDYQEMGLDQGEFDYSTWYDRLLHDSVKSGLLLVSASSNARQDDMTLVYSNRDYPLMADAISHALRLAQLHLPNSVKNITIVIREYDMQPISVSYRRQTDSSLFVANNPASLEILAGREAPEPFETTPVSNRLNITADLAARFQFFDPDNPLRQQIYLKVGASARLPWDWRLRAGYAIDIDNNFDEISRPSNSILPHVRSDADKYLQQGASGLSSFYLNRQDNLAGDVFYRLYAGVLEDMYSGVGGEMLWQPFRSRLAYGLSANWVQQRDYDRSFKHLDYTTTTAFASVYWATPFYNYDVALHVGQYLAKDKGATFEVRRTFDNGWMVGAWATLTNVPFDDFGEGSFDKGIFFRIPLDGFYNRNTRASVRTSIRSIQRDGGQRLEDFSGNLWYDLRASRYDALDQNRERMYP